MFAPKEDLSFNPKILNHSRNITRILVGYHFSTAVTELPVIALTQI